MNHALYGIILGAVGREKEDALAQFEKSSQARDYLIPVTLELIGLSDPPSPGSAKNHRLHFQQGLNNYGCYEKQNQIKKGPFLGIHGAAGPNFLTKDAPFFYPW